MHSIAMRLPPDTAVVFGTTPLQVQVDPLIFVSVSVVLFFVAALFGPLLLLRFRDARPPTAPERGIVDDLLIASEFTPAAYRVVETIGEHSITLSIRGPPGRRYLIVSDYVIQELDSDTAAALLAAEAERARLFYLEYRIVAAGSVLGIATAMFAGWLSFSDGLFILAVAALALFWIGRQFQFRADRNAADRIGGDELADAFEYVADLRGVTPEQASWTTWVEIQPPLGQRITRLRNHAK